MTESFTYELRQRRDVSHIWMVESGSGDESW